MGRARLDGDVPLGCIQPVRTLDSGSPSRVDISLCSGRSSSADKCKICPDIISGNSQSGNVHRWIERGDELIVVATDSAEKIIGFGSIVPTNSELRALHVDAAYGGQGVGRALIARLEELARDAALTELCMNASINAVPFYEANGFISLEPGEHIMSSGARMACVRMRKAHS